MVHSASSTDTRSQGTSALACDGWADSTVSNQLSGSIGFGRGWPRQGVCLVNFEGTIGLDLPARASLTEKGYSIINMALSLNAINVESIIY